MFKKFKKVVGPAIVCTMICSIITLAKPCMEDPPCLGSNQPVKLVCEDPPCLGNPMSVKLICEDPPCLGNPMSSKANL